MTSSYDTEGKIFMKIAIRPTYRSFNLKRFNSIIEHILLTQYKVGAKDDEAPSFTDCVTAVRYILMNSSEFLLPRWYIGDFPKILLDSGARKIPLQEAMIWDLVFFERMSFTHQKYMIAHIGIMVSENEFFHSSLHFWGGKISSLLDFDYKNSILDESFLSIAQDPRNK